MSLINLNDARQQYGSTLQANISLSEPSTNQSKKYDIFLSHSYRDKQDVIVAKRLLEDFDFDVYVDWHNDEELSRKAVTERTAEILRSRMRDSKVLVYLITPNSKSSLWMPWELGFFDGLSEGVRVAILPMIEKSSDYTKTEYLGLYPYVDMAKSRSGSGEYLWVNHPKKNNFYCRLSDWVGGKEMRKHDD